VQKLQEGDRFGLEKYLLY